MVFTRMKKGIFSIQKINVVCYCPICWLKHSFLYVKLHHCSAGEIVHLNSFTVHSKIYGYD